MVPHQEHRLKAPHPLQKAIIRLLPLLALYATIALLDRQREFVGDEGAYLRLATNLTHGYYSPAGEVDLWWGPGYPIVLVPFVLLKTPWAIIKLLNAVLLFFAVVYFYQTIRFYTSSKYLLAFSYLFGLYPPFVRYVGLMWTEILTVFLISAMSYHFCKLAQERNQAKTHSILAGIFLGYLALTKVFFGYVILAGLIIAGLVYLMNKSQVVKKAILVCAIALAACLPYLLYTYSLTGKVFYWGNSGGLSLYWMSTPYPGEYGDWQFIEHVKVNKKSADNHLAFLNELDKLPSVERDDALKKAAIQNIVHHPVKFVENWFCNIGRLFFDYPYSYAEQTARTYFYLIPNMFIVVLGTLSIYPAWRRRRTTPEELHVLLAFAAIAFAGSSFLSAYARQFWVLTPIIDVFLIAVLVKAVVLVDAPSTGLQKAGHPVPLSSLPSEEKAGRAQPVH